MRTSVSGSVSGHGDESRPSSQNGRDQLVVEAQSMPLAGKILHVRVYHVNVGTPSSTPLAGALSPLRSTTPDTSSIGTGSSNASQSLGFRVLAIDELDNEFSLFVSRQKAEYLFSSQSSAKSASLEDALAIAPSLEAMANSIIDHLDIIGNRHRDIGKLTCREPEVYVAKRTRATLARDAASKQKNPHLMAKNDQRAARAKKTVLRTMEAIATAQQQDIPVAVNLAEVSPRSRRSRKSSDESLLHRMAFSNDKPVWRSDLETNYEEQQQSSAATAAHTDSTAKGTVLATAITSSSSATIVGTSPPRRVILERKHKHKDLYERREKERKHRLLVARAKSSSSILEPEPLIDTTPSVSALALLERPAQEEERPKVVPDRRDIRARFNAAVRNAYAVRTFLGVKSPPEPEQFLRRRTIDHSERRVLKGNDNFSEFPGMGVEVTHERPQFRSAIEEDDPMLQEKLRILTQAARRSSFVRDKDGNLIRRSTSSRGSSARRLSLLGVEPLAHLVASSSAPALGAVDTDTGIKYGVIENGDEHEQNGEDLHGDKGLRVTDREHEGRLTEAQARAPFPVSSARETILVAAGDSIADATSSSPPPGIEVCEDDSIVVDATSTADPEVIFVPGPKSPSTELDPGHILENTDQPLLLVADQDAPYLTLPLAIEAEAYTATIQGSTPSVTPRRSSTASPIASSRRQTCWDEAVLVVAVESSSRHDPEPAEPQNGESDPSNVATPDEQSVQQPRPRPKSAGGVISICAEEPRFSPPMPAASESIASDGDCDDEESLSLGPVATQLGDRAADRQKSTSDTNEELPPQCLSAREPRRQPVFDTIPSVVPDDDCKTNSPSNTSNCDRKLELPTLVPRIAEELASRAQVHKGTAPSDNMLENLTANQADTEVPRIDVKLDGLDQFVRSSSKPVDCDTNYNPLDTTNGGEIASEGAEIKQMDYEDAVPSRDDARASVSDEQVSVITAAASTAVIAAAQTSSKSDNPSSSVRPYPVENRGNTTTSSDANPKGSSKTYSASPSSSQRGGPMLPRDSRHSPGKRRASIIRQQPSQALTDTKPVSRRKSVVKGAFPMLPDLSGSGALASLGDPSNSGGGGSGPKTYEDATQLAGGSGHKSAKSKRRRSETKSLALVPSSYHKTWSKWVNGRGVVEKISCLQLEEQVLSGQQTEGALVKLGLRYARWSGTSVAAILLLEHAAALHESAPRSHEFWNSMGNAHLDIFLRNRKFLPAASFHLERCVKSLTRALAFMESMTDPLLLLRFALCLFWHSKHGHLERADEIFRQLFSKFASFCDKDRVNLLFLHFQVLHRLKMFAEASECVDKIIALVSSTAASGTAGATSTPQSRSQSTDEDSTALSPAYDLGDYWMMKMQCQQASGDYMQASATFSRAVGIKGFVQDGSLTDEQYLELWLSVADKCFHFEDYVLATEYYPVALNFAKESQLLAAIHYKLGLCFQALGDGQRCAAEYKRARNMNRHVRPPVSLTELRGSYDDQFALLLEKSVRQVIEEVRVNLYDRAVRQLQRVFRRKRQAPSGGNADLAVEVKMPSIAPRKLSRPVRPISGSSHVLDAAGTAGANAAMEGAVADACETAPVLEETEVNVAARRQAEFEARKLVALGQMKKLRSAPFNDAHPPGLASSSTRAIRGTTQSELLSPEKDRPEVRRLRSMATFNHLGYLPSTAPCVEHWEKLLTLATNLFPMRRSVTRSTCAIRSVLPRVSDEVAFCALADALGEVDSAVERLRDSSYERELSFVCSVIDVERMLEQALPVRLPSISSPSRSTESPTARALSDAGRLSATNSPLASSLSTSLQAKHSRPLSPQVSPRPMRLEQMLDMQFRQRQQVRAQGITNAPASAMQEMGETRSLHEEFVVLRDFRQANTALMTSQSPFGLPNPSG